MTSQCKWPIQVVHQPCVSGLFKGEKIFEGEARRGQEYQTFLRGNTRANSPVNQGADTVNSESQPWGLYFSKAIFGGAYVWRGLCTDRNLRLKSDWASLLLGRKFTGFLCFTLYLTEISKYNTPGKLIFGGAI